MKERKEHTMCEICGHETTVLELGTGEYSEKMVCKLCEGFNFSEQLLKSRVWLLKHCLSELLKWYMHPNPPHDMLSKAKEALEAK